MRIKLRTLLLRISIVLVILSLMFALVPQDAWAVSETVLMSRVDKALRRDRRVNGAECYPIAPGVVVLHGTVFDAKSRSLAQSIAYRTRGVKQVINNLRTQTGEWKEREEKINDTLALNGFSDLDVRVIGSQAFLSGTVVGQSEQQRALRVIAAVSNLQVVNFSRVLPGSIF